MQKFTKLRALALSYNSLGESHLMNLCKVLEKFPCLVSLDLNGNYVGGCIRLLLNSVNQPLKCLRLENGRICDSGIRSIACSKHSTQLTELDISFNCLSSECLPDLIFILEASKNTLQSLNVSGNEVETVLDLNWQTICWSTLSIDSLNKWILDCSLNNKVFTFLLILKGSGSYCKQKIIKIFSFAVD